MKLAPMSDDDVQPPPVQPPPLRYVSPLKKRKWEHDPGSGAAAGAGAGGGGAVTPTAAQAAFRRSTGALVSPDEVTRIYMKYDPLKGIIAKAAEPPEKREAEKRALIEVALKPYRALMLAHSGLIGITKPEELARLESSTTSWEEKKQMCMKSTPLFSARHIDQLLVEAKARPSPVTPGLIIDPSPCIYGQTCVGYTAKLDGFQNPNDPYATEKQRDMGLGMTLMAAMTPTELNHFYQTGQKPDSNNSGFHSFCIMCHSAMVDVAVESRTSGEAGFDHKVCLQTFGVMTGQNRDEHYSQTSIIMPDDEKYNGLVYPIVRFIREKLTVYRDPETGLRRVNQKALLARPEDEESDNKSLPPSPPVPASAPKPVALIPYSSTVTPPPPPPPQPPAAAAAAAAAAPAIIPDPMKRAVANF